MQALEIFDTANESELFERIGSDLVKLCKNQNEIAIEFSNDAKNFCWPSLEDYFKNIQTKNFMISPQLN